MDAHVSQAYGSYKFLQIASSWEEEDEASGCSCRKHTVRIGSSRPRQADRMNVCSYVASIRFVQVLRVRTRLAG